MYARLKMCPRLCQHTLKKIIQQHFKLVSSTWILKLIGFIYCIFLFIFYAGFHKLDIYVGIYSSLYLRLYWKLWQKSGSVFPPLIRSFMKAWPQTLPHCPVAPERTGPASYFWAGVTEPHIDLPATCRTDTAPLETVLFSSPLSLLSMSTQA